MKKRRQSTRSKQRGKTPELTSWQGRALEIVRASVVARIGTFGGGAALSAVYLHHRKSADLDFFLSRALQPAELSALARELSKDGTRIEEQVVGSLTSLVLLDGKHAFGKIDLSVHPSKRAEPGPSWRGLTVESLLDMEINKIGALLNRHQARDYVDLYFLLQEGPEREARVLLQLLDRTLGVSADPFALASRFLAVRSIEEFPKLIRRVTKAALREFFWEQARRLLGKG